MKIEHYRDLRVFQGAMDLCMEIFEASKRFPAEERFSLVDQIRRSSRSVCANIGEAWHKRRYVAAFSAKLSDAESEASETQVWLTIARRCGYLASEEATRLDVAYDRVIAQIVRMVQEPQKWALSPTTPSASPPSRPRVASSPVPPLSRSPVRTPGGPTPRQARSSP
jgi:four helix bundle protein